MTAVAPRRVRRTTEATMTRNLTEGRRMADQSAVWQSVEHELGHDQPANPTRNLDAPRPPRGDEHIAAAIEELTARGPLPGQAGVLVSHGERMVAADLFGNPDLLADMWAGLVRSYYANAPERTQGRPSTTHGLAYLRYFLTRPANRTGAVALGDEYRINARAITGTGLLDRDRLVHATCFARDDR